MVDLSVVEWNHIVLVGPSLHRSTHGEIWDTPTHAWWACVEIGNRGSLEDLLEDSYG